MSEPSVSVVVSTRDRAERLEGLLASLRKQTLDPDEWEISVVDDGSRDGTPDLLERARAEGSLDLTVVRHERSVGPGAGRNAGWRAARGALVAFTDDDCEADPDWLVRGLAAAQRNPRSFVQGRTDPIERELPDLGPYSRTLRIESEGPYYQTCNMFYPRELLDDLGGFRAMNTGEDTDLAWRALEAGWSSSWAGDAQVFHGVVERGPLGMLRLALSWSDAVYVLARHPGLRSAAMGGGLFWKRSHRLLALAALGVLGARLTPLAAVLALPYARHALGRCAAVGAGPAHAGYLALYDLVEVFATVRGGVRHRVFVV